MISLYAFALACALDSSGMPTNAYRCEYLKSEILAEISGYPSESLQSMNEHNCPAWPKAQDTFKADLKDTYEWAWSIMEEHSTKIVREGTAHLRQDKHAVGLLLKLIEADTRKKWDCEQ